MDQTNGVNKESTKYGSIPIQQIQNFPPVPKPTVSRSRWYIITVVSLLTVLNNFLWATWGPISQSAKLVYQWSDNTLFWAVNAGNITGFLFAIVGCYLVDVRGSFLIQLSYLVIN